MRRRIDISVRLAAACLLIASAASAHHSFQAEFDANQPITLKGVVNRVDWRNPHSYIYLDVKGDDGKVVTWQCEGFPPNMLVRQGWTKSTLKAGDMISIAGYRAKDGSKLINSREVTFPDGTKRYGGPPAD